MKVFVVNTLWIDIDGTIDTNEVVGAYTNRDKAVEVALGFMKNQEDIWLESMDEEDFKSSYEDENNMFLLAYDDGEYYNVKIKEITIDE